MWSEPSVDCGSSGVGMDRPTFAQMVDYIEDWWGPSSSWTGADRLYDGFAAVDADACYEVLMSRQSDPDLAKYPPRPATLKAEALARLRHRAQPALAPAAEPDRYDWAEFSSRAYGEVIPLAEAVERRHTEIFPGGCQDESCPLHAVVAIG